MPDSALSIGPRLRALAVYLVVFQHVPVERCRQLIADVTGAVVSDRFIHSCLAKAASLATEVVALICALITAAPVAGFDETTLRSGPIRSYIDTARKHGKNAMDVVHDLMLGTPWRPPHRHSPRNLSRNPRYPSPCVNG